jgi:hypothetical protein
VVAGGAKGPAREVREARTLGSVTITVSSVMGMGGMVTASEGTSSMRAEAAVGDGCEGGQEARKAALRGHEGDRAPWRELSLPFSQQRKHDTTQSHDFPG